MQTELTPNDFKYWQLFYAIQEDLITGVITQEALVKINECAHAKALKEYNENV